MTINIEATIRWKGYNPNDLKPKSNKRVWAICGDCGKGRWLEYKWYNNLCRSCSHKGKYPSEETRKKLSEARKGEKNHMYGKTGEKSPFYGKHHSEETRKKMSEAQMGENNHNYGTHPSEETCKKRSEAMTGEKHPLYGKTGNKHPFYGKHHSEETRKKTSATHQGIPYDEWEGFAQEKPYCPAFNEACRESNREKYGRKCFICGLPESENLTKSGRLWKLSVHHIDMNKHQGCDGNRWKLIPICIHHHGIVHNNLWRDRIIYLLNTCWK